MKESIEAIVLRATGAAKVVRQEMIQQLWSGYGSIVRFYLEGSVFPSVIVKHVSPPDTTSHPHGWNTDHSHQRKLKSYAVETQWYRDFASECGESCRVPNCLVVERVGDEVAIVLEDLDAAGYSVRRDEVNQAELMQCVSWLAHFHATFLNVSADGLWDSGTYWHLQTRPDERKVLEQQDLALFEAAAAIDQKLNLSPYQTLVHGDAKLANFCFADDGSSVAAVDFQYVGAGCGMKDLAYFIGSCLDETAAEAQEERLLDAYFSVLKAAVIERLPSTEVEALETDWRALYPVAWTDFHRFLKGWSPGHWKINAYSERLAREVVLMINNETTCS